MKEQTESHLHPSSTDSHDSRHHEPSLHKPAKGSKTRPIHKDKNEQQLEKERMKLTKQERAKIQKEKNRQAAQRSRDMHKQYVSSLEKELSDVKEELELSKKYCFRCRQSLEDEDLGLIPDQNIPMEAQSEDDFLPASSGIANELAQQQSQPDFFMRIRSSHQENDYIKGLLFVCMVIIGVMVGFSNKEPAVQQPRSLVQVYSNSAANPLKQDAVEVSQVEKWTSDKGLVQLNRGIQDPTCLDSLMRVQSPVVKKSLTYMHDPSYKDEQDAIMLCSLRMPKSYEISPEITETPLVKLFVLGSEIKELVEHSGSWTNLRDRNIQLNGIYRLSAEIKNVELVSHHNCLL